MEETRERVFSYNLIKIHAASFKPHGFLFFSFKALHGELLLLGAFLTINSDVDNSKMIHEMYIEFSKQGINKALFQKVLKEIESKRGIKNFNGYLREALNNVINHVSFRKGTRRS